MHELGVVFHVIDQIEELAEENQLTEVSVVTLQLGEVSAVIPEYLTDCWNWAVKKHDIMKECKLHIEKIEAVTYCEECKETYATVEHGKICPHCGSENTYVFTGNDFLIKEIEAC